MLFASQILFVLLSLWAALVARAKANKEGRNSTEYLVISLSLLAAAVATAGQVVLNPQGSDSGTLMRIFTNLALYAAAPMLVTALVALARTYPISRPAWGRWLLGLFALFELCRRMGYGEQYTLILALCCIAGMASALAWFRGKDLRLKLASSTLAFALAVAAYYEATLALSMLLACAGVTTLGVTLNATTAAPEEA